MPNKLLTFLMLLCLPFAAEAQSSEKAFHAAANLYLHDHIQQALQTVEQGLRYDPNNRKLRALEEELRKKQEEQQQQQQKEQQQKDQQQQDNQQDQSNEQQQQQEGKPDKEKKEEAQEGKEEEKQEEKQDEAEQLSEEQLKERLKEMDMSPEKAQMILEAMKSNEIQYLQQLRRQSQQRQDDGKPDW